MPGWVQESIFEGRGFGGYRGDRRFSDVPGDFLAAGCLPATAPRRGRSRDAGIVPNGLPRPELWPKNNRPKYAIYGAGII